MQASVTLGLENSPFAAAIDQSEKKAMGFADRMKRLFGGGGAKTPWEEFIAPLPNASRKVDGLSSSLTNLFKRTPDRRAEVALSQFAASIAGGDVAGAVSSLGLRMTGFGLIAGVAVGSAIEIFTKFRGEVNAATEAERKLANELATIGGVRGPEEATKKIAAIGAATEALISKVNTAGNKFANFFDKVVNPLVGTSSRNRGSAQSAEIVSGLRAQAKVMDERSDIEAKLVAIQNESLNVSERQGALNKIAVDADKERAEIQRAATEYKLSLFEPKVTAGMSDDQLKKWAAERDKLIKASQKDAERDKFTATAKEATLTDEINKQFDLKKSEADIESKILELKRQGVTEEQRTTAETRLRIALLRSQLRTSTTEQKGVIQNKISALKQTLGPDNRPAIGIAGETPQGVYDPNTGEFRTILRPQEVANRRAGEAEAQAKLRDDQSKYAADMREWIPRYEDYLRGADYYSPEQLKRPTPPVGYDVDLPTGQVKPRTTDSGSGPAKPLTKEELQSALDSVMSKFWGN